MNISKLILHEFYNKKLIFGTKAGTDEDGVVEQRITLRPRILFLYSKYCYIKDKYSKKKWVQSSN